MAPLAAGVQSLLASLTRWGPGRAAVLAAPASSAGWACWCWRPGRAGFGSGCHKADPFRSRTGTPGDRILPRAVVGAGFGSACRKADPFRSRTGTPGDRIVRWDEPDPRRPAHSAARRLEGG